MAAQLSKRITTFSDGSYKVETPVQRYMHKEDRDILGTIRSCAPCPAVWVLKEDQHVVMDRQWQYYLRAINYNMTLENVFLLLDDHLAFANKTGFGSLDSPERNDYFFNRTGYEKDPQLDKVRTTSRSVLTGVESGSSLIVKTFDSTKPPPLKPGYSYPTDISRVDPNAYLYMPQSDPEMFLVATIVNSQGEVVQFPRGALYPWTGDDTIYSFVPHISNPNYGPVVYPLANLLKLPIGSPVPSPYRHEA